jgi:hypothetical protein
MLEDADFSPALAESRAESVPAEKLDPNATIFSGFRRANSFEGTLGNREGRIMQTVILIDSPAHAQSSYNNFDAYLEEQFRALAPAPVTTPPVSFGDRSRMYVINNVRQGSLVYYLAFVRGNVIEAIGLEVPASLPGGDDRIRKLAGKADRRITEPGAARALQPVASTPDTERTAALPSSGTSSRSYRVAVTAEQQDPAHIMVTYQGGADAPALRTVFIEAEDDTGVRYLYRMSGPSTDVPVTPGSSYRVTGSFSGKNHVTAKGTFADGSVTTILDTFV